MPGIHSGELPLVADRILAQTAAAAAAQAKIDAQAAQVAAATSATAFTTASGAGGPAGYLAPAGLASANAALTARRGVLMADWPRQGGETTDDAALDRALAYASTNGIRQLVIGAPITLAASHTITDDGFTLLGLDWGRSLISVSTDVQGIAATGAEFRMRHLRVDTPNLGVRRTKYPVVTQGDRPKVQDVWFTGVTNSWRSGLWIAGGDAATVVDCLTNHAAIKVSIYDVKVISTYLQAISAEYGLMLDPGAGNLELTDVDIVPPLRSVADAKTGLYIPGTSFKIRGTGIYIDGNGGLETREGILIGDGAAQVQLQVDSNQMSSDVVVLDSCYGVDLTYLGQGNNVRGNGARDIVVRQTGGQPVAAITLRGKAIRTSAVPGTAGPAVEVQSPVTNSEVTIDVDVIQPAGAGGYTVPEVKVNDPDNAIMLGRGTLSKYKAHGKVAIANGDTAASINLSLPYPLAYRPLASDIRFAFEGAAAVVSRVQFTSDNQVYIPFVAAASGAGFLHWRVDFAR